ncbi:MAG: hypothetical protein LBR30_04835 [Clostridioides sp.]|jgi:hypothetical protein|nr:hypothetical protein [Clostridioides sp.]
MNENSKKIIISLNQDILNIKTNSCIEFGSNQQWFVDEWQKMSGCGPCSAANIFAYLANTVQGFGKLCSADFPFEKEDFLKHMNEVWQFITPTPRGTNTTSLYTDGACKFTKSRGIELIPHCLNINSKINKFNRQSVEDIYKFIYEGLTKGCPVAFLNLSNGGLKNLAGWHWVTIFAILEGEDGKLLVEVSDQGVKKSLDIEQWVNSTVLGGGFVYFTF